MRRFVLAFVVALTASLSATTVFAETVIRAVMSSDVKATDPVWSGAYITRDFAYMIYDTLFALDENLQVKPQMVDKWQTSDDGLIWTFTLRDGLEWHDGTPVTAEDCVASLKRWSARDSMGQKLAASIAEYRVVDAKTFQIVLKQKFGPLLEALGKPSVATPFMTPKSMAETDPFKQSDNTIGSGPFIFKKDEWKPGEKLVFVKNPKYKPRPEPSSGLAGGKVVKVDRVEWRWIPDSATQLNALLNGEIDWLEIVDYDHLGVLEKDKNVRLLVGRTSNQFVFRMNWMQPPFNNVKIRRAAAVALSQEEFLQANVGDKRFYKPCRALFTCDTLLASTAGLDDILNGDTAKAKQMLQEAGYDGTVIVMPQPTDLGVIKQLAPVAKSQLEKAGFKVEIQPMDWQSMVARLISNKGPPSQGGWNAFGTSWTQLDILNPLTTPNLVATCEKARAGWPCDADLEKLRDQYALATSDAEKKAAAEAVQRHAMQVVTHVPLGEWHVVGAVRANIETLPVRPPVSAFWDVSKK